MAWAYVLRPSEMAAYRRCRRAWDLGARVRQNLVPAAPGRVFDFDRAMHDALAVYYFPAMDDWDRAIVRPLAVKGFQRAMQEDRGRYEAAARLTAEQEQAFGAALRLGEAVLEAYFAWAGPRDTFASIFSDQEYWAPVPDPADPGSELTDAEGHEIRYLGRVDQLFSDDNDEYWVTRHRLISGRWATDEELLLDLDAVTDIWATEITYPQLRIAGTVYNELRVDIDPAAPAEEDVNTLLDAGNRTMREARHVHTRRSPLSPEQPEGDLIETDPLEELLLEGDLSTESRPDPRADRVVRREGTDRFRRTYVRRGRASIRAVEATMAAQTLEVTDPALAIYPSPSASACAGCTFRAPCRAMSEGLDPSAILAASFRPRTPEEGEEERLRWSIGRAQTRASMSGKDSRPDTVNFHWG